MSFSFGTTTRSDACPASLNTCGKRHDRTPAFRIPVSWVADNNLWSQVNRIDDVRGDRKLLYTCVPKRDYDV
jgi:hypothetical protein